MNTNDIEFILSKTKEALSGTIDAAKPLAVEIVRQVQLYHLAYLILGALMVLFALTVIIINRKGPFFFGPSDSPTRHYLATAACLIMGLAGCVILGEHVGDAVAPMKSILRIP